MPLSYETKKKLAMFHEFRKLNSAAYAIAHRAKGTPFETRAKAIHAITLSELSNFQHDPEATIDTLQDHDLDPLILLIGHIVALEF